MKTLLIFPAQWYPTQPYLSTPYLTSYLRAKGWEVDQRDFNIASYEHFLSVPLLRNAETLMAQRLESLKSQSSLSIKDKSHLDVLAMGLKFSDRIIAGVEEAKSVLRTPERFFDFPSYQQADMVIKSALKLVSDAHARRFSACQLSKVAPALKNPPVERMRPAVTKRLIPSFIYMKAF